MDVASNMNLLKLRGFWQTLRSRGVDPGLIVLPFFGPSNGRDTVGLVVDWYTDPVTYLEPVPTFLDSALRVVDKRADLLGASKVLERLHSILTSLRVMPTCKNASMMFDGSSAGRIRRRTSLLV